MNATTAPPAEDWPGLVGVHCSVAATWQQLCELAALLVQDDPCGPLESDVVVVPGQAHRRALSQHLASRATGPRISAGLDFIDWSDLEARLRGAESAPDPWQPGALAFAIWDAVSSSEDDPTLAPLVHHIGAPGERPGRAHATASRVARLFDGYAAQAPAMVDAWRAGHDVDPTGQPLSPLDRWQPALWRRLVQMLGEDPVVRTQQLLARLAASPSSRLPGRVLVMMVDDPTAAQRDLLSALANHHRVHLFVLAGADFDLSRPGSALARHYARRNTPAAPHRDSGQQATLLGQVQHDLRHDLCPAGGRSADGSIAIHACHGPDRQVQVLRDVLCGLLSDDPTLQPRDIVVACTDLAAYAPLIQASFGLLGDDRADLHPGHRLRAQLAGARLGEPNPVLTVVAKLFELHAGRATSVDLIDWCQLAPVAHRFGFDAEAQQRIADLVGSAEIRWGVDAGHRRRNLVPVSAATWFAGVERMVASLALNAEPPVALDRIVPISAVDGGQAGLIGALAELVSRLRKVLLDFATPASGQVWASRLRGAVELLTRVPAEQSWQLTRALGTLARLAEQSAGREGPLQAADVAAWLRERAAGSPGRPSFGNGALLFTGLGDLQGIAARVVCVLGLDDTRFPGASPIDGDDLLARRTDPHSTTGAAGPIGRHWTTQRRDRNRQRLVDALLSAQERFIVITRGADEATGAALPKPICIADLLDACAVAGPAGQWARHDAPRTLVNWHELHPHGWGEFVGSPVNSFDKQGHLGALALSEPPQRRRPGWQSRHPDPLPVTDMDISDLQTFYAHPARALLREQTGTSLTRFDNELSVELPIDPDERAAWSIGRSMFDLLLAGHDPRTIMSTEWLSGRVLPGPVGEQVLIAQLRQAERVAASVRTARWGDPDLVDCEIELGQCRVSARLELFGDHLVEHRFGWLKPVNAVNCWIQLVVLAASGQAPPGLHGVLVGKRAHRLDAPDSRTARQWLDEAVRLRSRGLGRVLPLPLQTAAAHADLLNWDTRRGFAAARPRYPSEDADWHYFFDDFDQLLAPRCEPDDPLAVEDRPRFSVLTSWLIDPITQRLRRWHPKVADP